RAVGYFSSPIPGAPFDAARGVVPNIGGRVTDGPDGEVVNGMYATGWVKRGPVGLIGSTKSDAQETIGNLVADYEAGLLHATTDELGWDAMQALLNERGVRFTTWEGWELLEEYEKSLGEKVGRNRIKVVERETMTAVSRGEEHDGKLW
ncbi:MAG: pyridine nucleotide-disulfide oxidoreductase, partial [Arcanobacterium sp.]|nr:pyridine nucleotide-disulfide oxidoreductase [Arcanobacterium sp.]